VNSLLLPNPAAAVHAWPMQHPELAVVFWSAGMLLVFAPLAVQLLPPQGAQLTGREVPPPAGSVGYGP
jgi:hypothetical protein